jgi:uncharacterized repeat protein (TIGR03803 family)
MLMRVSGVLPLVLCLLAIPAGAQIFQPIYSFPADKSTGRRPLAALTIGPDGALYGTTTEGGAENSGTAFKVTVAGTLTQLGNFEAAITGRLSSARLVNIGDGFLYGATQRNDNILSPPAGTLFRLDPNGGPTIAGGLSVVFSLPSGGIDPKSPKAVVSAEPNTLHVLGNSPGGIWRVPLGGGNAVPKLFSSNTIGSFPESLIRGSDGFLYGVTSGVGAVGTGENFRGTIFRVAADGSGLTRLHDCLSETGVNPYGAMVQGTDGFLYGTTEGGGANLRGCVFRISTSGDYTVIHDFNGLSSPRGDLLLATDGYLYGTTRSGGSSGLGGVFRLKPDGSGFQVVHVFTGANGAYPHGGLVQAGDGNLYGTTYEGGTNNNGTVYRLQLQQPPVDTNRAPVAVGDVALISGTTVTVPVLDNDFDPDNDPVTVTISVPPSFGTATVLANGSISYESSGNVPQEDLFTYTITDGGGKSASANVLITTETPPPLVQSGVYTGLLYLDPELTGSGTVPRALYIVSVTGSGEFTGVLNVRRKRVPIRGSFDQDGTATVFLNLPGREPATIYLGFRGDEPGSLLAILDGAELWSGTARPVVVPAAGASERYTVLLESEGNLPAGYGYATMRIASNGVVAAVGKMGDGTKLSWGTTLILAADGSTELPVFGEPMKGGVCGGFLSSTVSASQSFAGALRWLRPAGKPTKPYSFGFDGQTTALVSAFTPPLGLSELLDFGADAAGIVTFAGGPLSESVDVGFDVGLSKAAPSTPIRSLSFNRKTGLFTGKVQVGPKTVKFGGAVNQQGNLGAGQIKVSGETAGVVIEP